MAGDELYSKGQEKLSKFYETAPYGECGGMHSTDYKRMIVEEYFIHAAEKGCVQAMKECGDYYSSIDRDKAIKFYKLYLNSRPSDALTKAVLIAKFGFKMIM